MNDLTQEQEDTIVNALSSLPREFRQGIYGTLMGVQEQIARGDKFIFYMAPNEFGGVSINKMKIGED